MLCEYCVPINSVCVAHSSAVLASAGGAGGGLTYFLVSTSYALRVSIASHARTCTYERGDT
ncbi:hypothetical protein E2C01_086114 [Portunus trituberculatus]|uniref:Uncharacterized protein n=1 Tax=Portunus trituberculatus TaxID=210409 RepID=A0A5B7J8F1_PORTR|nr:hypothetical protein [Portunus trituberculatus]